MPATVSHSPRAPAFSVCTATSQFHGWAPRSPLDAAVALIWEARGVDDHDRERVLPTASSR